MSAPSTVSPSSVQLRFAFYMCNDPKAISRFYGELLGAPITGGGADDGYVGVKAGVDLLFFQGDFELPVNGEWAWQPGYKGGAANLPSLSLGFSEEDFRKVWMRLSEAGMPLFTPVPQWRRDSYWGLTTRDPMGNTLELYTVPTEKPDSLEYR